MSPSAEEEKETPEIGSVRKALYAWGARGILFMFCEVPIVFSVIGGALFLLFPITRARHEEALAELSRRRELAIR